MPVNLQAKYKLLRKNKCVVKMKGKIALYHQQKISILM